MGKVDDMRRLREQRAAESARTAPSTTGAGPRPRPLRAVPAAAAAPAEAAAGAPADGAAAPVVPLHVADEPAGEQLCGHQSISGRSCTRERDHQKTGTKNHRYG